MILLLFWPALILALGLSILGISYRAPGFLFVAALLTVPTSLYIGLGGELRGGVLVALLPLFPAMGALAVRSGRRALAALLLLVPLGYFSWFGWNVAHQAPSDFLPAPALPKQAGT
jgi:TRAP-type C4-dicarboxylate transport system permease small subunit